MMKLVLEDLLRYQEVIADNNYITFIQIESIITSIFSNTTWPIKDWITSWSSNCSFR